MLKYKFYHKTPNSIPRDTWSEITEEEFHHSLYQHVSQVTPVIKLLLFGKSKTVKFDQYSYKLECSGSD